MGRKKSSSIAVPLNTIADAPLLDVFLSFHGEYGNPSQWNQKLVDIWECDWRIISWWVLYKRIPAIDIAVYPYNTPEFRQKKAEATMLSAMLDCCEGLKDRGKIKGIPLNYWHELIEERRKFQYERLGKGFTKSNHKKAFRDFLWILDKERKVPDCYRQLPLQYEFLNKCLDAAWGTKRGVPFTKENIYFKDRYWVPYLTSIREYIDDCAKRSEMNCLFQGSDGKLYTYTASRRIQQVR